MKVVDTNVYLNSLNLVMMVRSEEILAVPWTVLQELDKLKVQLMYSTAYVEPEIGLLKYSVYRAGTR